MNILKRFLCVFLVCTILTSSISVAYTKPTYGMDVVLGGFLAYEGVKELLIIIGAVGGVCVAHDLYQEMKDWDFSKVKEWKDKMVDGFSSYAEQYASIKYQNINNEIETIDRAKEKTTEIVNEFNNKVLKPTGGKVKDLSIDTYNAIKGFSDELNNTYTGKYDNTNEVIGNVQAVPDNFKVDYAPTTSDTSSVYYPVPKNGTATFECYNRSTDTVKTTFTVKGDWSNNKIYIDSNGQIHGNLSLVIGNTWGASGYAKNYVWAVNQYNIYNISGSRDNYTFNVTVNGGFSLSEVDYSNGGIKCISQDIPYFIRPYDVSQNDYIKQIIDACITSSVSTIVNGIPTYVGKLKDITNTDVGAKIKDKVKTNGIDSCKVWDGSDVWVRKDTVIPNDDVIDTSIGYDIPNDDVIEKWLEGQIDFPDVIDNTISIPWDYPIDYPNDTTITIPWDYPVDYPRDWDWYRDIPIDNPIVVDPDKPYDPDKPITNEYTDPFDSHGENLKVVAFDLTELFPFCIPFDIIMLFKKLLPNSESIPKYEFKFDFSKWCMGVYSYTIDFADFQILATITRDMLFLLFILGLMKITRSLIRG